MVIGSVTINFVIFTGLGNSRTPLISSFGFSTLLVGDKETFDPTCTGNWCRRLGTYTNFNPGVIVYKYHEDWKVGGGAFRNSLGELGFLMGGGYEYKNAGVEVGIASGYEKQTSMNNVIPMYSIYYRLWIFKFTLNHEIANVGLSVRF